MITMPDALMTREYENNFYLSCESARMGKIIAHYELFKKSVNLPGAVVECGVFKGASLLRFAMFREFFSTAYGKNIIGFDTFAAFPQTHYEPDKGIRDRFVQAAGEQSISVEQLKSVLEQKKLGDHCELIAGDICVTVPEYVRLHAELKISVLHLDTDVYEPAKVIMDVLYPRLVTGGVLILDDYGIFPGETKAVDDYFGKKKVLIQKMPYCTSASYIIKE